MKLTTFTLILLLGFPLLAIGQDITITASDHNHISLHFELDNFSIDTVRREGELMHTIATKGIIIPNDYGLPALPTFNRFIAIPQGATAIINARTNRDECITGINIVPSEGSQYENDPERPFYKDPKTYTTNSYYPSDAYYAAEPQQLRGVDVIHLGISPFQFNPVTQELAVHHEMDIDIRFEGGNGHFGDDRLRSPYWDPILKNNILNYDCLSPIDYDTRRQEWTKSRATGCEYLILTPDDNAFISAAQELADYRTRQGILTKVMSIAETGSTSTGLLRQWFREIYDNWEIPPVAVCILADHGENLQQYIPAYQTFHPIEDAVNTDNPYADINNDHLPDICFSRLVAQNESELSLFIDKQIEYEFTNPVSNPYYYSHPITAGAWQNAMWFQITIATISGYLSLHGKDPVRINEVYSGYLGEEWSTTENSISVTNYFGPNGLGYIPATPGELGGWTGGTADQVIQAINSGAYLIQHRDHGWTQKWYQPAFYVSDFDGINNPGMMPFLISVNCRTGQFDFNTNCFTEALLRMTRNGQNAGIVGAIAPIGQTYSFANDIYLWGVWDLFDPEFLPDYGPYASHVAQWMPAFANVSGKYFLEQTVFPNTDATMRQTTYNAFHSHCDAFLRIYTEMPQAIEAVHDSTITFFTPFHITAPEGVQIALSSHYGHKDHLLATATGTGEDQVLYLMDYEPINTICLTMTGVNFFRHEEDIPVAPLDRPYVIVDEISFNQGETQLHYGELASTNLIVKNAGALHCDAGTAHIANNTGQLQILQSEAAFPDLAPEESATIENAFQIRVNSDVPDGTAIPLTVTTQFNGESYERDFDVTVIAPCIKAELITINDAEGDNDGYLDPGEFASLTFRLTNDGHYVAENPHIALLNHEDYIRVITPESTLPDIPIGGSTDLTFDIFVEFIAGEVSAINLVLSATCNGLVMENDIKCTIGFSIESFENNVLDPEYWTNDPQHPWQIINIDAYDGSYCAQSDTTTTHNESSYLTLTYTSNTEGTFSFYSKVSSEWNYDFLTFSIDDEEKDQWSGTMEWNEYTYSIMPGQHQYKWCYTKDFSVDSDSDCAWIDYISLPPYLDGVNEQADIPLTLHPNPTTNQINIGLEQIGDFTVEIFDSNGNLVMSKQNTAIISFDEKPSGMYLIVVRQNGQRWSRRIIKM